MNKLKYLAVMLIAVVGLGLQQAQADLLAPVQFEANLGAPDEELADLQNRGLLDEDCIFGAKFEAPNGGAVEGDFAQFFTVDFSGNTATITWDLSGTGFILGGVLIKDGSVSPGSGDQIFRFYGVTADQQIASNGEQIVTFDDPVRDISHISFFVCPAGGVPDGGTTVMLLGAALGSLGMVRRYLKS
jgi:VPDSG-CTERM motif